MTTLIEVTRSKLPDDMAHIVTTLQGRLVTRLSEALERSSGMTLSRVDFSVVWYRERCSAT